MATSGWLTSPAVDADEVSKNRQVRMLAGEYADLVSISHDLGFVADAIKRYVNLDTSEDPDGVLRRALWWSAAIAYRRSFTTGRGHGLIKRTRLVVPAPALEALTDG